MASPSASPVTPVTHRRRQRSTRVVVAVALLLVAAALVIAAALTGSWVLVTVAGAVAVLLGAAAVRITHSELMDSRVLAAQDRAAQAKGYLALTHARVREHAGLVSHLQGAITSRERSLADLEAALAASVRRAADATRAREEETRRAVVAERERDTVAGHLDKSETAAAEAIVRVAELEHEIDVLRSELAATTASWRAAQQSRKGA